MPRNEMIFGSDSKIVSSNEFKKEEGKRTIFGK